MKYDKQRKFIGDSMDMWCGGLNDYKQRIQQFFHPQISVNNEVVNLKYRHFLCHYSLIQTRPTLNNKY